MALLHRLVGLSVNYVRLEISVQLASPKKKFLRAEIQSWYKWGADIALVHFFPITIPLIKTGLTHKTFYCSTTSIYSFQ